jgi:eukaryotic-like serine/threonine-protein kinase
LSISLQKRPKCLGKYELQEKLGYGGAAEVWKAFDPELHRYVAIKLLHTDLRTDPQFTTRFSHEARFVAALHHPNIVQIYAFQTTHSLDMHDPIAYMVMDYVEGETLAQYIRKTSHAGKFPAPTDIVHLFASIGQALDYAHQEGMIHRDVKPSNILLDKRHSGPNSMGEPVLTDFGVAKIMGASSDTMTGMWLGTPRYVSPEQAQGYPLTTQSDIYSLGVILYEICTGVCPFRSENALAILMQHIRSAPLPPDLINPALPSALTTVILRAMAKKPAERFSSASALTIAIAEAFQVPVPAGLLLPNHPTNDLLEITQLRSHRPDLSLYKTVQGTQQSQPLQLKDSQSQLPPVPTVRFSPTPPLPRTVQSKRAWKGKLIACFVVLFMLVSSTIASLYMLQRQSGQASPTMDTLTFSDSQQYDPSKTVGYNDKVTLSLHSLTTPQAGMDYFAWLMPDQRDGTASPLLLGRLSVNAGNAALEYDSPAHTNLLAQYSGVRIIEQPANGDPSSPSSDPKTWRWEGWIPNKQTPGDESHYSLLDHLRHLLAKDPTLQENGIAGGLVTWMMQNVGKVQEWSSAAQGNWGSQMPDGDADLIHRHLLRILDYLDGQSYVWQDVPIESPWLVDEVAGKLGLLSYTQDQKTPGYLQHVDIHLQGLAGSPGHTEEQKKGAIQEEDFIARMIKDLTIVRDDARTLVKLSNADLRRTDTLTLLNKMLSLTTEANSGWFDATTRANQGGAIRLSMRIQQLATISLQTSNQQ